MTRALIGTGARFFVGDGHGDWEELLFGEGVGEPILMGLDLSPGPELVTIRYDQTLLKELPEPPLRNYQRTHPTTARELRRAERRRGR